MINCRKCENCKFADKLYLKKDDGTFHELNSSLIMMCGKYCDFIIDGVLLSEMESGYDV